MRDSSAKWQDILGNGFASARELLDFLQVETSANLELAEKIFSSKIPRRFANLMQKGDPEDPLLLQVLASIQELEVSDASFIEDPLLEKDYNKVKGLIHKYAGRVLLTVTGVCAINCRYCFRRYFPYQENNPGRAGWHQALDYIKNDDSITEVIFSGGDPLLASDATLEYLFAHLARISHVETIRIHTRIPVVLPERITQGLLSLLQESRFKIVMVIHSNHPHEISKDVQDICLKLYNYGVTLLNQSVLLRKINDNSDVLKRLSVELFKCRVMPYYLHLLDKTKGTQHFDVPLSDALVIFRELQTMLPGYLVPRLAQEQHGRKNKILIQ